MICTNCGKECHKNKYPEIVFLDSENVICEECSIDYEQTNGKITKRKECMD